MGITDAFSDGQFKYWSSAKDYVETGAAWESHSHLDGIITGSDPPVQNGCAQIKDGLLNDSFCDQNFYGLCELTHTIC